MTRRYAPRPRTNTIPQYAGAAPRLLYVAPSAALSFATYEWLRGSLMDESGNKSVPLAAAGTLAARALSTWLRVPFDIVKQRLQIGETGGRSGMTGRSRGIAMEIFRREGGTAALFRGYPAALMRDTLFSGTYYVAYEMAKRTETVLRRGLVGQSSRQDTLHYLIAGGIAGATACLVSIPLDVTKTRIQTARVAGRPVLGTLNTMRSIYAEEGSAGLRRGLPARLVFMTPAAALSFAFYENYKKWWARTFP